RVGVALPDAEIDAQEARQALAEGIRLGAYRFLTYKSGKGDSNDRPKLSRVDVAGGSGVRNQAAL
ncbi:MAG: hypothetical protein GWN07_20745, partial [Actinobacteria bacterium]|nr:hypothetical protein [Actinomycetota bacterium]NIU68561.1 hypothetical protein [Actinomycetota bacterium]NIV57211.1 hypothetical protein [Actinomycetota bacterium]NIV88709.1 hypothetical protein [Actinomycetota bacterium]NIW30382.1 hypothetical protein [Actinomycetota bacterium]